MYLPLLPLDILWNACNKPPLRCRARRSKRGMSVVQVNKRLVGFFQREETRWSTSPTAAEHHHFHFITVFLALIWLHFPSPK